jgi:hypothetical protein
MVYSVIAFMQYMEVGCWKHYKLFKLKTNIYLLLFGIS